MIANKLFKQWRVDGNLSWQGRELDDIELRLRSPSQETLEQEFLRLDPGKWESLAGGKITRVSSIIRIRRAGASPGQPPHDG